MKCIIADLGLSNVGSVSNMLRKIGAEAQIAPKPPLRNDTSLVVLPGVGSFDAGMYALAKSGWGSYIQERAPEIPIIGICLGMQLLGLGSSEGTKSGLGILPLSFESFAKISSPIPVKSPHMGWNKVFWSERHKPPIVDPAERYYFVHSFASPEIANEAVLATSTHGVEFVSIVKRGKTVGFQFHPEKSHRFGQKLLSDFLRLA